MLMLFCQDFEISITLYHLPIPALCLIPIHISDHGVGGGGGLLNRNPKTHTSAMAASLKESEYRIHWQLFAENTCSKKRPKEKTERERTQACTASFTAPHQAAPSKRSMEAHACEKAEGWWKIKLEHNVNIGYVTELCTYKWLKQ